MSETSSAISLRPTLPASKWLGTTCPKCTKPIAVGETAVLCPKCYVPHHAQCWRDGENRCANDQTPARILEPRGKASGSTDAPVPTAVAPAASVTAVDAPVPVAIATLQPLANPWLSAKVVQAPPETEIFRRNVMAIVSLLGFWAICVFVAVALGVVK